MTNHQADCACDLCLLTQMRSSDAAQRQQGWEAWYQRDAPRLLGYLKRACWEKSCPEYAEELLQDAFVIGFENISSERYDERKAALRAYLHGIAKNLVREIVRLQQREPVSIDELTEEQASAIGAALDKTLGVDDMLYLEKLYRQIQTALDQLPYRQRCVVYAFYVKGSSANEVAKEHNLSPENARVMAHRGVLAMQDYLAHQYQIPLSARAIRLGLETGQVVLKAELQWDCELQTAFPFVPASHTIH